jgi:hypothetical protein
VIAYTPAREGRADTMGELGRQTDPLEPPGRRCGCWPLGCQIRKAPYPAYATIYRVAVQFRNGSRLCENVRAL